MSLEPYLNVRVESQLIE